jgi:hypothetical protein
MTTSINLPDELMVLLREKAKSENRSLSSLIRVLLVEALTVDSKG